MLYLAAIFAPVIVYAWTRRPWWTGLFILLAVPLVLVTFGIMYIVYVVFAIKFAHEYYSQQRAEEMTAIVSASLPRELTA